jgi:imidazoleglycerol-phosphate dehydratase
MDKVRSSQIVRQTAETEISVHLAVDGSGKYQIETPVPFLNHMLTLFAVHSRCDLQVSAAGDTHVDDHHTVEDIGICLGQAIKEALGGKQGINRYGQALIPMDEALARVVIDLSGRSFMQYTVDIPSTQLGNLSSENVKEFFQAIANQAGMTIHIDLLRGENSHHIVEAVFKAFARAFKEAVAIAPGVEGVWSSKGKL